MVEKEKLTTIIILTICLLAIAIFGFGKYFTLVPLDDYAIYDDFSDGVFEYDNSLIEDISNCRNYYTGIPNDWTGYKIIGTFTNDKYEYISRTEHIAVHQPEIVDGKLKLSDYDGAWNIRKNCCRGSGSCFYSKEIIDTFKISKNLKGIDSKFNIEIESGGSRTYRATSEQWGGAKFSINGNNVYSVKSQKDTFGVEFKSHILDKDLIDIYSKGIYVETLNITDDEIFITITPFHATGSSTATYSSHYGNVYIDSIKFRIPFNCKIEDGEHLVYEDYYPGETLQIDENFKLSENGCEVRKFCLAHPAVLASAEGTMTDYNAEIYQKLVRGDSLTVPQDQNWKVIFITKKSDTGICKEYIPLPVQTIEGYCSSDESCPESPCTGYYYKCNKDTNKCEGYGACIQPKPSTKDLISQILTNFINWVKGLFT